MSKMYKISGEQHTQEITYYSWDKNKEFPNKDFIKGTHREFEGEFESMDEASLWLLVYHPDLYMGHSVVAMDGSGDFSMHCVPSYYYSEWHTTNDNEILYEEMARLVARVHFKNTPSIPDNGKYFDDGDIEDFIPEEYYSYGASAYEESEREMHDAYCDKYDEYAEYVEGEYYKEKY